VRNASVMLNVLLYVGVAIRRGFGASRAEVGLASDERPRPGRSDTDMLGAILFWIIVGLIAGALAKWVMPGTTLAG
jgi:hypothetical protein